MSSVWSVAPLLLVGLAGAWFDLRERRLPNWLCGLGLLSGLVVAGATGGLGALGWHGAHAAIALAIGIGLFALGVIGAGDAKFYAALASWFPLTEGLRLFVAVALAGGLLALVWMIVRRLRGRPALPKDPAITDRLPYGVAISAGAFLLALGAWV